jgi:hypothetical protein
MTAQKTAEEATTEEASHSSGKKREQENSISGSSGQKKKAKKRKKRKISKHILEAKRDHEDSPSNNDKPTDQQQQQQKKAKKSPAATNAKDPSEAATYLSAWKYQRASWKFNKNTQSWLIKHLYEPETLPKSTFTLAVEYLKGSGGKARLRVLEEARRRAVRYKEYEKKNKAAKAGGDDRDAATQEATTGASVDLDDKTGQEDDDVQLWNHLDDHGKRKVYKRARKLLEALDQEQNQPESA